MKKLLFAIMYANSLIILLSFGGVLFRIWTSYPCNHWGIIDIRYGFILCFINVALGMMGSHYYGKTRQFITAIVLGIVMGLFLFFIDYFNILVEYELWLQRGLPEMWEIRRKVK